MSAEKRAIPGKQTSLTPASSDTSDNRVYIAIDIESTGVDNDTGDIIEVAVVKFRLVGGQARVLEEWQTMVKPQNPIPYKITNLTGIRQADVEHAPSFGQVRDHLRALLADYPIVGHSVESDMGFLRRQHFEVENATLDTYELATLIYPQQINYGLKALAENLQVATGEAHRALADARMTVGVFSALAQRIAQLPPAVLEEVDRMATRLQTGWSLHRLFKEAIEDKNTAPAPEENLGNLGALLKIKLAQQSGLASNNGTANPALVATALPEVLPALEVRPIAAEVMAQLHNRVSTPISEAFSTSRHILLEVAGGGAENEAERTRGMLAAAVEVSRREGKCAIIAVRSETQRERLLHKAIPQFQQELGKLETPEPTSSGSRKRRQLELPPAFKAATVKNQQNYLCQRRWEQFRASQYHTDEEIKLIIRILVWLPNTTTGDSSELRVGNIERLWSRVNSLPGLCRPEICLRYTGRQCYFLRALETARKSHVVITDQALVLANLVEQAGTLPDTNWIIIEDSHLIEDEASRQFGSSISPYTIFNFLDWISRAVTWLPDAGNARDGFLHTLPQRLLPQTPEPVKYFLNSLLDVTATQINLCRESGGLMLRELGNMLVQLNQNSGQNDGRISLDKKFRKSAAWDSIMPYWYSFQNNWEELYYRLVEIREETAAVENFITNADTWAIDLTFYINQSNRILNQLSAALDEGDGGQVYWLASSRLHTESSAAQSVLTPTEVAAGNRNSVTIHQAPLDIAPLLEKRLFNRTKSVAMLSQTLTTVNDFHFMKERLGLEVRDPLEVQLPSPRDYSSLLLALPNDMPQPSQPGYQKHIDQQIIELTRLAKGRTVVVFSSNSAIRLSYKAVQRSLEQEGYLVLGQGLDGTRRSMMTRLRSTEKVVLLTNLFFWETTDLAGEDEAQSLEGLFNLIVFTKLPFDAPSDPLYAARLESNSYDNAFEQYSLPRTILRFRQSFERLLAGLPDNGSVVMLDSRIMAKQYGSLFLNSLPPLTQSHQSLANIQQQLQAQAAGNS